MWLQQQVSFYDNARDTVGCPAEIGEILHTWFAVDHFGVNDMDAIVKLRSLDPADPDYKATKTALKSNLQAYTPAALLTTRKGPVESYTGIMSLDFDDIDKYDPDELKASIGALPFVGYCGLSVSGRGLYALVLIAEPEKQTAYAEHLFQVFKEYGIQPDTSKGRNVNDMRFVSYDSRPVINEHPTPLRIKHFKAKPAPKKPARQYIRPAGNGANKLVSAMIERINNAQVGQRWATVQQVAFTLGGLGDPDLLELANEAIRSTAAFTGEEDKYMKCANDCFRDGSMKPLIHNI